MNIVFESKEVVCDNVEVSWYLTSPVNQYRATITFCGGIDEDGNENLYNSCFAEIRVDETKYHIPEIIEQAHKMIKDDLTVDIDHEPVMINAPSIRLSMVAVDEDSFESTMETFKKMVSALASVVIDEEIRNDIDNPISDL